MNEYKNFSLVTNLHLLEVFNNSLTNRNSYFPTSVLSAFISKFKITRPHDDTKKLGIILSTIELKNKF